MKRFLELIVARARTFRPAWPHMAGLFVVFLIVMACIVALKNPTPVNIAPLIPALAEKCHNEGCSDEDVFRAGDLSLCRQYDGDSNRIRDCVQTVVRTKALQSGSDVYCQYLQTEHEQMQCRDQVAYSRAIAEASPDRCQNIEDTTAKERCTSFFSDAT